MSRVANATKRVARARAAAGAPQRGGVAVSRRLLSAVQRAGDRSDPPPRRVRLSVAKADDRQRSTRNENLEEKQCGCR